MKYLAYITVILFIARCQVVDSIECERMDLEETTREELEAEGDQNYDPTCHGKYCTQKLKDGQVIEKGCSNVMSGEFKLGCQQFQESYEICFCNATDFCSGKEPQQENHLKLAMFYENCLHTLRTTLLFTFLAAVAASLFQFSKIVRL